MKVPPNMLGSRFERLKVVAEFQDGVKRKVAVSCDCGRWKLVRAADLVRGMTRSCGCLSRETASTRLTKHGHSRSNGKMTPTYHSWANMLKRVRNPNDPKYPRYGGRGIAVCERWLSFVSFLADMGERPPGRYSIDRINNDGNYEPGNCRWATDKEQANNRRPRRRGYTRRSKETV